LRVVTAIGVAFLVGRRDLVKGGTNLHRGGGRLSRQKKCFSIVIIITYIIKCLSLLTEWTDCQGTEVLDIDRFCNRKLVVVT